MQPRQRRNHEHRPALAPGPALTLHARLTTMDSRLGTPCASLRQAARVRGTRPVSLLQLDRRRQAACAPPGGGHACSTRTLGVTGSPGDEKGAGPGGHVPTLTPTPAPARCAGRLRVCSAPLAKPRTLRRHAMPRGVKWAWAAGAPKEPESHPAFTCQAAAHRFHHLDLDQVFSFLNYVVACF